MSIVLYHHPYSRAATVVWMLEELGLPYELRYTDLRVGEQKTEQFRALNPMGKLPTLVDGPVVLTESAAIGVWLADRYPASGLAPSIEDPARATYLRWAFYAPSVIEPGAMAHANKWEFRPGAAGWGTFDEMIHTMERALDPGPWLLGERFSMADVIFGGTLRYMLRFKMIEATPRFSDYVERLGARPAAQRAAKVNEAVIAERGLA